MKKIDDDWLVKISKNGNPNILRHLDSFQNVANVRYRYYRRTDIKNRI